MADENKNPNQNPSSATEMEALQDAFMEQFGVAAPVLDAPTVEDQGYSYRWSVPLGDIVPIKDSNQVDTPFPEAPPQVGYVGEEQSAESYDGLEFYTQTTGKGLVEGVTAIPDAMIQGVGWGLGQIARQLGFNDFASDLENPITVYDVVRGIWESPQLAEKAVTGADEAYYTRGFDISPRKPKTDQEAFWSEVAYLAPAAVSFPVALTKIFGYTGKSPAVQTLLYDAGTRGANSALARKYVAQSTAGGIKDAGKALVAVADEYALNFAAGLGKRYGRGRTLGRELFFGGSAGAGFGLPHFFDDENSEIMLDLGEGIGEVNVKPTIQLLASMGIPIGVSHTPSGWALNNAKSVKGLLAKAYSTAKGFAGDLFAGVHPKGQKNLASRVWMAISDSPEAMVNILEPAISSGAFRPRTITLSDGTVVPHLGGLTPDTIQAMNTMGIDSNNIIAMNQMLRGRGNNAYYRDAENTQRAQKLEDAFNSIRNRSATGDQTAAFDFIQNTVQKLDDVVAREVARKLDEYSSIKGNLESSMVEGAEVSNIAVQMVRDAQEVSRGISQKLWSAENIGTNSVNSGGLGDWAAQIIKEAGRDVYSTAGWEQLFKLAGRRRLAELGLTKKGTNELKPTGDELPINPKVIEEQGMFDQFGDVGPASMPVEVINLQNYRHQLGDMWSAAKRAGNNVQADRLNKIIQEIDDNVLVSENLIFAEGATPTAENLRNLEIARAYTANQYQTRWGPKTAIGKLLGARSTAETEGFLNSLLKQHTLSGARVEAWRAAINEPVPVTNEGGVSWKLDPDAPLTTSGSPNVIEAELLRRLTLSTAEPTEKFIGSFIRKYQGAIDKVPGLEARLRDLQSAEAGVMMMSSKLTTPSREAVQEALKRGAAEGATPTEILNTIESVHRINLRKLADAQQNNIAKEYLGKDRGAAAEEFINLVMNNPGRAAGYADELARLLEPSEQAMAGFRGALWDALAKSAQRPRNPTTGEIPVGVNTEQLRQVIGKSHPLLKNWLKPAQIEFLDELVRAGPWQDVGGMPVRPGEVPNVDVRGAGTSEAIGAGGRVGGQAAFGLLGINPLVATGMGRRIAVTLFKFAGEKRVMEMIERAMRDPDFAAELINNYKTLPQYEIAERAIAAAKGAGETVRRGASQNLQDSKNAAKRAASLVTGKTGRFLSDYSLENIRKAVRFGLIPASEAATRIDLETDYEMGAPFLYPENDRRWRLETDPRRRYQKDQDERAARAEKQRLDWMKRSTVPSPAASLSMPQANTVPSPSASLSMPQANPASVLDQVDPFGGSQFASAAPQGTSQPDTVARMEQFGLPLFAAHGGIASIKPKKPRQMVL